MDILNDKTKKRLILKSESGTGKTWLLKEKVRRLLSKAKKVVLSIFQSSGKKSLTGLKFEQEFKGQNNATVHLEHEGRKAFIFWSSLGHIALQGIIISVNAIGTLY